MKIMLIHPPSRSILSEKIGIRTIPLGLAYLASYVGPDRHEIKIIDAPTLRYQFSDLHRELKQFGPHVVGLTATTSGIYGAYETARIAKESVPACTIVVGGPHVSFTARQTLEECEHIDVIVRGEGEITFAEFVDNYTHIKQSPSRMRDIPGLTFRLEGQILETEERAFIADLNQIPFPAYELLSMERYRLEKKHFANIMTSRGCPFNCIFCSSSKLFGKKWRERSPENVVAEIRLLVEKFGVREIEFLDDTFTLNKKRAARICDLLSQSALDLSWACSSRVDTIDEPLARKLKEAGCHTIYVGVESGSQKILDTISKGITISQAEKTIGLIRSFHLNSFASFIIGIPGETVRTIKRTISFARQLRPTFAQFTICTPYPGTKLFELAREKGWLATLDWSKYTILDQVMKDPEQVIKNLNHWLIRAYLSFYLRPAFLWEQLKKRGFFSFIVKRASIGFLEYLGVRT